MYSRLARLYIAVASACSAAAGRRRRVPLPTNLSTMDFHEDLTSSEKKVV